MKILWLASWYPNKYEPYNGDFIQRHARAVAEVIPITVIHVMQAGWAFEVKEPSIAKTENNGLTEWIYAFPFKPTGVQWLDKIRYNLLYHAYSRKAIAAYIKEHGKPDFVHVHIPVKAGLIALYAKKKFSIPYIVSEQSSHYEEASPFYFLKRSKYFQKTTKRTFENALAVTNVSETIGKKLETLFNIQQYRTIHNLVDTSLFYYKQHEAKDKLRLIHVSALGEQKNPTGIIEALSLLKETNTNWECVICGPHNEALQQIVTKKALQNHIIFTGEINYTEVAAQMQQSDIFIMFSNHENFPCVVIEALCCGLPVIAADTGGVAEAVNESNGKLVAPGDIPGLCNVLNNLIVNIKNYNREEIATDAASKYSKQKIAADFIALYKALHYYKMKNA